MGFTDLQNGSTGDADEVNDNFRESLLLSTGNAINIENASNDTVPVTNLLYGISGVNVDHTNTTAYARGNQYIVFLPYIDAMDDASVSAVYWSTSTGGTGGTKTTTETGTDETAYMQVLAQSDNDGSASNTTTSSGSTGIDLKSSDNEVCFYVEMLATGNDGGDNSDCTIRIAGSTSGTATIESISISGDNSVSTAKLYRVVIDESADEAKVYEDNATTATTTVDLSSLSGTSWYLEFHANTGNAVVQSLARIRVFGVSGIFEGDSTSELTYRSDTGTLDTASTSGFGFFKYLVNENSPKVALSANGGTGFSSDSSTKYDYFNGLTSGSDGRIRIRDTSVSTIATNYPLPSAPVVQQWGAIFR